MYNKEKLLANGDKWEPELAAAIRADARKFILFSKYYGVVKLTLISLSLIPIAHVV